MMITLLFLILNSFAMANDGNSCATLSAKGKNCNKLQVEFDLSLCEIRDPKPVKVECKNGRALAYVRTERDTYSAELEHKAGTEEWNLIGPIYEKSPGKKTSTVIGHAAKSQLFMGKGKKRTPANVILPQHDSKKEDPENLTTFKEFENGPVTFRGLLDLYYGYNTQNTIGNNTYRFYDIAQNRFALALAEFSMRKTGEFGFDASLDFGQNADINAAGARGVDEISKHLGEAKITYHPRWGKGIKVYGGKMYTHVGFETSRAIENWNYSRSSNFGFGGSIWHLGAGLYIPLNHSISATGYVYNGSNEAAGITDNNRGKTIGVKVKGYAMPTLQISYNLLLGPEQDNNDGNYRTVNNLNSSYDVTKGLSFAVDGLIGSESGRGPGGVAASWYGIAIYSKFIAMHKLTISPRLEFFKDSSGVRLGATGKRNMSSATLTHSYQLSPTAEARAEFRWDSTENLSQVTGTAAFLYSF